MAFTLLMGTVLWCKPASGQANYSFTALAGAKQPFLGYGESEGTGNNWLNVPQPTRDQMTDMVFRDLKAKVFRLWVDCNASSTVSTMTNEFYSWWVSTGAIAEIKKRGTDALLFAPGGEPAGSEPLTNYAARLAQAIYQISTNWNVNFTATGIANEPGDWAPTNVAACVKYLRADLNSWGLTNVLIIAPESPNNDSTMDAQVNAVLSDVTASNSLGGIASHSYNMAVTANEVALKGTKQFWMTEAGANVGSNEPLEDEDEACTLAARFLNDMNHSVNYWVHFIGYLAENVATATDSSEKMMDYDTVSGSPYLFLKYYYFKQLLTVFERGAVFRQSQSTGGWDMAYTYGGKPPLNLAVALNPDGSWGIGIVNDTGVPPNGSISSWNAATNYNITLTVQELASVPMALFQAYRSRANEHFMYWGTVTMTNGVLTVTNLAAKELICLRTQPAAAPAAPTGLMAYPGDGQVTLGWAASWNTTAYNVKRGLSVGGPFTTIASGLTNLTYTNFNLSEYTNYYYVVSATNAYGEGANSLAVSVIPTTLLVNYTLDETSGQVAHDVSGQGNNAVTANASPAWQPSGGMIGGCLSFSATSATSVGQAFSFDSVIPLVGGHPFTLAAWINTTQSPNYGTVFLFLGSGSTANSFSYYNLGLTANSVMAQVTARNITSYSINNPTVVNDGQWHHVVGTFDGTASRTLYVDGVAQATDVNAVPFFNSLTRFSLGALLRTNTNPSYNATSAYNGQLDDVGVWAESLSPQKIALLNGLGRFEHIGLTNRGIDNMLGIFNAKSGYGTAGAHYWTYVTNLTGGLGATGGSTSALNAYIVLSGSGTGVQLLNGVPLITSAPQSRTNVVGTTGSFNVQAVSNLPLKYQWYSGSSPLANQTNATLTLTNIQFANAGSYSVGVSNSSGGVTSAASLVVAAPPTINNAVVLTNGHFNLVAAGVPGFSYTIQYSSIVSGPWTNLTSITAGGDGLIHFEDTASPLLPARFYRLVCPP